MMSLLATLLLVLASVGVALTPNTDPDLAEMQRRARNFTESLMKTSGLDARAEMSTSLRQAMSHDVTQRLLAEFRDNNGAVVEVQLPTIRIRGDETVVAHVPVHGTTGSAIAEIVFERKAPLARVTQFVIKPMSDFPELAVASGAHRLAEGRLLPPYADRQVLREERHLIATPRGLVEVVATLPATAGASAPVPAVLLVAGLHHRDADGSSGTIKPLRDLAMGLASRGVATWRYAPTIPLSEEDDVATTETTLVEDFDDMLPMVHEALVAARHMLEHPSVDRARITVMARDIGTIAVQPLARQIPFETLVLLVPPVAPVEAFVVANDAPSRRELSHSDMVAAHHPLAAIVDWQGTLVVVHLGESRGIEPDCVAQWKSEAERRGWKSGARYYQNIGGHLLYLDDDPGNRFVAEEVVRDLAGIATRGRN